MYTLKDESQELIARIKKLEQESAVAQLMNQFGISITSETVVYFRSLGKEVSLDNLNVAIMIAKEIRRRQTLKLV